MDKSDTAAAILAAYPQSFRDQIADIEVKPLAKTYRLKPAGKNQIYNIIVKVKPSAYYANGTDFVLCKAFTDNLYLSTTQQVVQLSSPELPQLLVAETDRLFAAASSFGCCARYQQCSDEGRCIHPNPFYANGCVYRHNLEDGKNFYRQQDV